MVTMCFVAKSPQPTTRVFGLGDIGITPREFEQEILSLVAIPDEAMPATGLEEGDSFCFSSRGKIRNQTWTWFGHYRHAIDPGGRKGAYFAVGVLLLNQTCKGQAIAAMINALDVFFRREILEDYQRIPNNWQSLQLSTPVKLLSTQTDAHVGGLRPGGGLSADARHLMYRRESLTFGQVASFLDTLQFDPRLQSSGRIVFAPSVHFAEKLNARLDLDAFDGGTAQDGVELEAPERTAAVRLANVRDVATAGLPVVVREPARFFDSEPAVNVSALERKLDQVIGRLDGVKEDTVQNNRAIRLHRRVAWLCAAIAAMAIGYGLNSAIGTAAANAELTNLRTGRVVDILSAEISRLKAEIAVLRIPPKLPVTHTPKPPHNDGAASGSGNGMGNEGMGNETGNANRGARTGGRSHHNQSAGPGSGNHHVSRTSGSDATTGGGRESAPHGSGGTKRTCRTPNDSYDDSLPLCSTSGSHSSG